MLLFQHSEDDFIIKNLNSSHQEPRPFHIILDPIWDNQHFFWCNLPDYRQLILPRKINPVDLVKYFIFLKNSVKCGVNYFLDFSLNDIDQNEVLLLWEEPCLL